MKCEPYALIFQSTFFIILYECEYTIPQATTSLKGIK